MTEGISSLTGRCLSLFSWGWIGCALKKTWRKNAVGSVDLLKEVHVRLINKIKNEQLRDNIGNMSEWACTGREYANCGDVDWSSKPDCSKLRRWVRLKR